MYYNEITRSRLKHEAGNVRVTNCNTCIRKCTEIPIFSTRNRLGFAPIYSRKEKKKRNTKNEVRRHTKWITPINHQKMTRKLSVEVPSIKDIIQCGFFFPLFGRESTTWPANNCLQIMVCSCVEPSKRVLLQIIFCSCVIGTTFSRETTFLREKWQNTSLSCQEVIKIWKQTWWSNDKTIIELGYHKISWFARVSQAEIIIYMTGRWYIH